MFDGEATLDLSLDDVKSLMIKTLRDRYGMVWQYDPDNIRFQFEKNKEGVMICTGVKVTFLTGKGLETKDKK